MFKIEKNIPISPFRSKYPIDEMEIGDSFRVPEKIASSVRSLMTRKLGKKCYTSRKQGEYVRFWRLK